MGRLHLGEFEELILLTVGALHKNAYAVAIAKHISTYGKRKVNVSAVHKSLYRLEDKGMLKSELGGAEAKRGGKRKRIFILSTYGKKALNESEALRSKLRSQIQEVAIDLKTL